HTHTHTHTHSSSKAPRLADIYLNERWGAQSSLRSTFSLGNISQSMKLLFHNQINLPTDSPAPLQALPSFILPTFCLFLTDTHKQTHTHARTHARTHTHTHTHIYLVSQNN